MFSQVNWRILALVLMTALPFGRFGSGRRRPCKTVGCNPGEGCYFRTTGLGGSGKKRGDRPVRKGVRTEEDKGPRAHHAAYGFSPCFGHKTVTAMSVMLLERDGKLRYESTLTEIFPDFPAYGKAITIRHLLTHTSGLPDYEDLMDQEEKSHGKRWSPAHQSRTRKYSRYWKSKPGAIRSGNKLGL